MPQTPVLDYSSRRRPTRPRKRAITSLFLGVCSYASLGMAIMLPSKSGLLPTTAAVYLLLGSMVFVVAAAVTGFFSQIHDEDPRVSYPAILVPLSYWVLAIFLCGFSG